MYVRGSRNRIHIGKDAIVANTTMEIIGSNNNVYIAENCVIENSEFCLEDEGCATHIGPGTPVGNAHFAANENGSKIEIGADCMLARGIDVRTGDSHGIYDISQDLNKITPIFPGIDLGDYENRIAIQVTSDTSLEKVKGTITQFCE